MKKPRPPLDPMTRKALKALREAVAQIVEEHRREGRPLAEWRNGKAVLVSSGGKGAVRESPPRYRTKTRSKNGV